jgi:hypothetical protein
MALKGDREIYESKIDCFLNEAATAGSICCYSTYGSGIAMDNIKQLVTLKADPSGQKVAGVLIGAMVDIDTTRQLLNTQKDEVVKGSKVHLVTEGWIVTDKIEVGTITGGEAAYVGHSGLFANAGAIAAYPVGGCAVTEESNATKFPMVGRFETTKDELNYCKIKVMVK